MKFHVGVIGATGYIGTPYRQEIREAAGDAEIVALCARRRDRLERAAAEDAATLITADWREVVKHPAVNLVLVLTPDALHCEPVLACAELGKHVFCEKPVGANVEQAYAMWKRCRNAGIGHFVPFWTRYVPLFQRAREIVRSGTLGEIRAIIYRWHNPRPAAIPFTWRDDARLSSAGSIADVGSHAYDLVRWITGQEAVRVLAHAESTSPPKPSVGEIDLSEAIQWGQEQSPADDTPRRQATACDYATIAWQFSGGAVGALILSHAPFLRKGLAPELEFHGDVASLAVDRVHHTLTQLTSGDDEPTVEQVAPFEFVNRFERYVFPAFRERAAGSACDHPGLEDGWRVQIFTDAAAASARRGEWVELGELDAEAG